jgi:hypothetical protein
MPYPLSFVYTLSVTSTDAGAVIGALERRLVLLNWSPRMEAGALVCKFSRRGPHQVGPAATTVTTMQFEVSPSQYHTSVEMRCELKMGNAVVSAILPFAIFVLGFGFSLQMRVASTLVGFALAYAFWFPSRAAAGKWFAATIASIDDELSAG